MVDHMSREYWREQDRLKWERDQIWIQRTLEEIRTQTFEKSIEIGGIDLLMELMGQHPWAREYLYSHKLNELIAMKEMLMTEFHEKGGVEKSKSS